MASAACTAHTHIFVSYTRTRDTPNEDTRAFLGHVRASCVSSGSVVDNNDDWPKCHTATRCGTLPHAVFIAK